MQTGFPQLLREHRQRRRWSQEQLAAEAGISTRHLSCLETGKSWPSREMVVLLGRVLELTLREKNALLLCAGFAPRYPERPLDAPELAIVQRAIDLAFEHQEPFGAILIDVGWNVLRMNQGAARMLAAVTAGLAIPPRIAGNLVRVSLHPEGIRARIVNFEELASTTLERVARARHAHPANAGLAALHAEIAAYPGVSASTVVSPGPAALLHLRIADGTELRLLVLLTTVGTPLDVTAEELTIESFFPADEATERWFRALR